MATVAFSSWLTAVTVGNAEGSPDKLMVYTFGIGIKIAHRGTVNLNIS
jgi:hypothetical protein